MNVRRREVLTLPAALGLLAPPARADAPMQARLAQRLRAEGVGLAAARVQPDGRVELAAEGRSGLDAQPLSAELHALQIGSLTKTFTALLLADAVLQRKLRLDDPVEDLLGQRLRDRDGLPLRLVDVATHRSGLPRLPANLAPASEADPYAGYGEAALLEALARWQPLRGRAQAFEYSNLGFGLLGWLVARALGRPLDLLMRERVLQPLRADEHLPLAQGHDAAGRPVPAWRFDEAMAGAGALALSAAQLARVAQAWLGHVAHPLGAAMQLALQVHSELGPAPGVRMGLGWMRVDAAGAPLATHDGGTGGFSSSLWMNLRDRRGALVLANAQVGVTDLARHLMDERHPLRDPAAERQAQQALAQRPAVAVGAAALAALSGVYGATPDFQITVRARGTQLFAQATGQGEIELFAASPRRFFARVAPLEVVFDGESGRAPRLVLHQGGRETSFARVADAADDARRLDAAAVAALAGVYALNADFKLTLRADGSRLFARATGQGEFELFARDARRWFARVTPLEVRFDGEAGAPAALTLSQAGRDTRFVRE